MSEDSTVRPFNIVARDTILHGADGTTIRPAAFTSVAGVDGPAQGVDGSAPGVDGPAPV